MGGVYRTMLRRSIAKQIRRIWPRGLMRSGMLTGLILVALVACLGVAYRERGRGNLHKLRTKIGVEPGQQVSQPRPGGQEAILLTRSRMMGTSTPEFISLTLLPGRGLNVLQITAYIPGTGEVDLLASPSLEGADAAMSGKGDDADGEASLSMGGAFELPWAGRIWGEPSHATDRLSTSWRGHSLTIPASTSEGSALSANGGMLLNKASDSVETTALLDGSETKALFHAGDFNGRWPSKTDMSATVLLGSNSIELTVTAQNVGNTPEPVGIGWSPRFAARSADRAQMRLMVSAEKRLDVRDRRSGLPTGEQLAVAGTAYDFNTADGVPLAKMNLDECFVALHRHLMDSGPVAELVDPVDGYGLRLTALSSTIQAMHVVAPVNSDFVMIDPQFNFNDPFGHEWANGVDSGMVVLQRGQSTEWKVRLEIFSTVASQSEIQSAK
jgi:galactose mutarotase-like enzyme